MKVREPYKRLGSLWGHIDRQHNRLIATRVQGERVLDVECGYGSLVAYLTSRGFRATGTDSDAQCVEVARRLFPGIRVQQADAETIDQDFVPAEFDTLVLKDVLHHLVGEADPTVAFRSFRHVLRAGGRIVVLDPNPMWILRQARKLAAHEDPEASPELARRLLESEGFTIQGMEYFECVGLPLSGGYVGVRLVPNLPLLNNAVAWLNRGLSRVVTGMGLGRQVCWRYLIWADLAPHGTIGRL